MTVEAALVLPLFMIGMLTVISAVEVMIFHVKMQQALYTEAQRISIECMDGHNVALSTIKEDVRTILVEENASFGCIENGYDGISFENSELDNREFVVLLAEYNFTPIGANIFGIISIPVVNEQVAHVWCGYINGFFDDDSQYVYVANDSQVFHRNRECTHIKLSIKKVNPDELNSLRNEDGAKYRSCEICYSKPSNQTIYITAEGSRYHNRINCSGLKRTVRAIKYSEIGNRRPCSRCGR